MENPPAQWPVVRVIGPQVLARAMETLLEERGVPVVPVGAENAGVLLLLPPCSGANQTGGSSRRNAPTGRAVRMVNSLACVADMESSPPGVLVRALVSADDPLCCVLDALRAVSQNKAYCSPRLLPTLLDFLQQTATGDLSASLTPHIPHKTPAQNHLSVREAEVARAAAHGQSNEEIAQDLCISVATVKFHLGHIFQKLAIARRSQIGAALHDERR